MQKIFKFEKIQYPFFIVQLQLSPFSLHYSPLLYPATPPTLNPPPPLYLSMGSLYMFFDGPFLLSHSPLPSGYCQFVLYFHVSGSILLTCLFCCLASTYRWDHTVQLLWKTVWNFLRKLKMELPIDLAIPLLGLYSKNPGAPMQNT